MYFSFISIFNSSHNIFNKQNYFLYTYFIYILNTDHLFIIKNHYHQKIILNLDKYFLFLINDYKYHESHF